KAVTAPEGNQGFGLDKSEFDKEAVVNHPNGETSVMKTGALAIAAITSCTNTSNPYVMLGAGLLAKNAIEKGLRSEEHTSELQSPKRRSSDLKAVTATEGNQGFGLDKSEFDKEAVVNHPNGETSVMKTGALAIAAITSCTNTSNPYVMLGAGLLAKNAIEKGLKVPEYVKTSLAPGSTVVTRYLDDSGLSKYLDELGFNLVGYGCTTCIGNSGPLREEIEQAIIDADL